MEIAAEVSQQAVLLRPQHQYSEVSVPSHGVICAVLSEEPF